MNPAHLAPIAPAQHTRADYTHHHLLLQLSQLSLHTLLLLGAHGRHERLVDFLLVRDRIRRAVHEFLDALKRHLLLELREYGAALLQAVHYCGLDLGELDGGDLGVSDADDAERSEAA